MNRGSFRAVLPVVFGAALCAAAEAAPKTYFECGGYLPKEAMPLSVYGVPVGTGGTFTIQLPADYDAQKTNLAVLWILVDDIDATKEASIHVNGQGPYAPPAGCLGEGAGPDRMGREGWMKIDQTILKPGDNEVKFVFEDNLGGSTGGFDILRAMLIAVGQTEATAVLPMIERDVYIEVPDFGTLAVYDRSLTPARVRMVRDEDAPGWKEHAVRKGDGSGGWVYQPAKFQFLNAPYGATVMPFGLALMDNGEVILAGVWNEGHQRIVLAFSKDGGNMWSDWHLVRTGHGRPMMLAALGKGRVTFATSKRYFSSDYGRSWPWEERMDVPPVSNGGPFQKEGNPLLDRDAEGNVIRIAEAGFNYGPRGTQPAASKAALDFVRWSEDGGRSWKNEAQPKEWLWEDTHEGKTYERGVSEGSLVRAANGWVVAALRMDMPAKFIPTDNDNYEGIGISISKDEGKTWSVPKVLFKAGRMHPHLLRLPNGDIVMGYILRQDVDNDLHYASYRRGCEAIVSHDNGETWDIAGKYALDDAQWTDGGGSGIGGLACGHTCSVGLPNGDILAAYGHYLSKAVAMIRWRP
ncbi:MAG: sialidase family protein [Planctomycetota bacterium]